MENILKDLSATPPKSFGHLLISYPSREKTKFLIAVGDVIGLTSGSVYNRYFGLAKFSKAERIVLTGWFKKNFNIDVKDDFFNIENWEEIRKNNKKGKNTASQINKSV